MVLLCAFEKWRINFCVYNSAESSSFTAHYHSESDIHWRQRRLHRYLLWRWTCKYLVLRFVCTGILHLLGTTCTQYTSSVSSSSWERHLTQCHRTGRNVYGSFLDKLIIIVRCCLRLHVLLEYGRVSVPCVIIMIIVYLYSTFSIRYFQCSM